MKRFARNIFRISVTSGVAQIYINTEPERGFAFIVTLGLLAAAMLLSYYAED